MTFNKSEENTNRIQPKELKVITSGEKSMSNGEVGRGNTIQPIQLTIAWWFQKFQLRWLVSAPHGLSYSRSLAQVHSYDSGYRNSKKEGKRMQVLSRIELKIAQHSSATFYWPKQISKSAQILQMEHWSHFCNITTILFLPTSTPQGNPYDIVFNIRLRPWKTVIQ